MKKLILATIIMLTALFIPISVMALESEKHYENSNGVILTQKELKFVNDFYGTDYFEKMTLEDYDWIKDLNIDTSKVQVIKYDDYKNSVSLQSISHSTASKGIKIAKSCSKVCTVITSVEWYKNPAIRSYDVIGHRFTNTSMASDAILTKVNSSQGTSYFSNFKVFTNGLGCSIKLPDNASNLRIEQKIYLNLGGHVYSSYQHSNQNISLSDSKNYSIGPGTGNVFNFYGSAIGKFDNMNGVDIDL